MVDGHIEVNIVIRYTIFEDTTTKKAREVSERVRNEVQNKAKNEENIRAAEFFVGGMVVLIIVGDIIEAML
ncbi:hypothetical protein [Lysinibacillus fusiformis]|uniref:hypothetical protein n=1 Tax=Lysinibacillus fusiformis TaxID=28031 RepID=UPI0005676A2C|nr:hypothetical protein [Lysinibacillus fusiformis]